MNPAYDLALVQAAVERDAFMLGKTRCVDLLLPHLDELARCRAFARDVVLALEPGDFSRQVQLAEPFDEYGVALADALLARHGLDGNRAWYVKLKLWDPGGGDEVLVLSLHPLERELRRVAGVLRPSW